jgi:DNA modification methylase
MNAPAPQLDTLAIRYHPTADLKPDAKNAREHTTSQVQHVVRSIQAFGWTNPILVDEANNVLAGHARLDAAKKLGLATVPIICLSHMTAAQKRAYIIADNRLAEVSGSWNKDLLAREHERIRLLDPEFDLSVIGFRDDELLVLSDNILEVEEDRVPAVDESRPPVSQLGDLWVLGQHRLVCGNSLERPVYERLMDGASAQAVIADFPYNVRISGNVVGKGKHAEFAMASGEMSSAQFTAFLKSAMEWLIAFSADGSIHFLFMDWRHLAEMTAATSLYTQFKNLVIWNKENAGLGTFYRSKHELIFVMKNGKARHVNNFGLGEKGRHRSNVWDYPGANSWGKSRAADLAMHPTVKPVAMIADAMKDCSHRGGIILDNFGGSGTTIMAAEATGRLARVIELDHRYVDVSIRR